MKRFTALLCALVLLIPASAYGCSPATRGQFVQALYAQWGAVPYEDTFYFTDVAHDTPYTAAVCWAHDSGFVNGDGDRLFSPDRPITREEAAVILRRVGNREGRDTATISNLAECNDFDGISPWADDSLYWATEQGYINWSPAGLMDPLGLIPLESVSGIFERFYGGT